jgi:hypothetical protein
MKRNIFEIPLLSNIIDAISMANAELQSYLDLLNDQNVHYPYSLKQAIVNLSNCLELLIKFRLLVEHWSFIFEDINKAKEINLDTGDFISVSFNRGIERLGNICNIDIDRYFLFSKELYKLRNKLVHYTLNDSLETILETIVGSIKETYDFAHNEIVSYINDDEDVKDIMDELELLMDMNKEIIAYIDDSID